MISDRVFCMTVLPISWIAQVLGLRMLSFHPIAAVLILLSAMTVSLRLAAGVCGAPQEKS